MWKIVSFFQNTVEPDVPEGDEVPKTPSIPAESEVSGTVDAIPPAKGFAKAASPELGEKLSGLAAKNSGELVASCSQMVGLRKILDELGDSSDDIAGQVYEIAETTLQAHLSEEDIYEPHELSFLVCFAKLDALQAAEKAKQIEAEIQQKILGEGLEPKISDITTDTRTVKVSDAEISQSDDVLSLIAAKITRETGRVKKGMKNWSDKYIAICEIDSIPVATREKRPARFEIAKFSQRTRDDIWQLLMIGASATEVAAEADCMMARRISELVCQGDPKKDPLTVIDVHYSTLSEKLCREKFIEACRPIKEVCSNWLIVRVIYSFENPPDGRFPGLVNKLGSLFQSRILQIRKPRLGSLDLPAWKIPIVSMSYREIEPAMNLYKDELQGFIQTVHTNQARFLVGESIEYLVGVFEHGLTCIG